MSKHLTVQDKILIHLSGYTRFAEAFECPDTISQSGIAEAIGKSRAHTTLELKKLKETDQISERIAHVRGSKVKKKVYNLTTTGTHHAQNLKGLVDDHNVKVKTGATTSEMKGMDAVEALKKSGMTGIKAVELVLRDEDLINLNEPLENQEVETHPLKPKYFFGREKELAKINDFLEDQHTKVLTVNGIQGIGKTTLAAKVAESQNSIYIQLYDFDSPLSISQQLGRALKALGKPKLSAYLENRDLPELREIGWHIQNSLEEKTLLVFDDYNNTGDNLDVFIGMLFDVIQSMDSTKMLVLSTSRPGFYSVKDLTLEKTVNELPLEGLDEDSSAQLLNEIGEITDSDDALKLVQAVAGHPLALELAKADSHLGTFEEYIYEQVQKLPPKSMELLSLCAVLRRPFRPMDMKAFGFEELDTISRTMFVIYEGGRMRLHQAVANAVMGKIESRGIGKAHELAAEYCDEFGEEPIENIHHLIEAGLTDTAVSHVHGYKDYLLSSGNLISTLSILEKLHTSDHETIEIKAEVLNLTGEWEASLRLSEQLVNSDIPNPSRAKSLIRMARIISKLGDKHSALETIQVAEKLLIGKEEKNLNAAIKHTKASIQRDLGDFVSALKNLGTSIQAAVETEDSIELLRGLMERGIINMILGNHTEAKDDLTRALETSITMGSQVDEARVRLNLSIVESRMGESAEAIKQLETAISLGRELEQPRIIGYGLVALAECQNEANQPETGLEVSEEAIRIFESLHTPDMVSAAYSNKATSLAKLGMENEAFDSYNTSLELMKDTQAQHSLGLRYLEYGIGSRILGNREKALQMLTKAAELFQQIGAKADKEKAEEELSTLDQ